MMLTLLLAAICFLAFLAIAARSDRLRRSGSAGNVEEEVPAEMEEDDEQRNQAWGQYVAFQKRKREFRTHLDARLGVSEPSDALNYEILKARDQAPMLRRLVSEELRTTVKGCVSTHWLAAAALRAQFIYEAQMTTECFAFRERVVDIAESAVERLEHYPLLIDEPALVKNLVLLRSVILPTCRNCPYLAYRVGEEPALCPTAERMHITREELKSYVQHGQ